MLMIALIINLICNTRATWPPKHQVFIY